MSRVQPETLGDAYPALCNFLRLTSLTLAALQLAMTVQVGDNWRHGGLMNCGQLPTATLREMLSSQPMKRATPDRAWLSLSTHRRSLYYPEASIDTVLVGQPYSPTVRCYHLRVYVPGLAVHSLSWKPTLRS